MSIFYCSFFLASKPKESVRKFPVSCNITTNEIGDYGHLYTGKLIQNLGKHYEAYVNAFSGVSLWDVKNTSASMAIGPIKIQNIKEKSQVITGNIGEAVVMPALASCMGITLASLSFQRIKAYQKKCPDFRFDCDWHNIDTIWNTALAVRKHLPHNLPLEVKTILHKDSGYLLDALEQLYSYWKECEKAGNLTAIGYGLIARINLNSVDDPGSYEHHIRYYLFARKEYFSLKRIDYIFKKISEKNFKKKYTRKPFIILKWIGLSFL